jgi:PAS domain S-box-containing protein
MNRGLAETVDQARGQGDARRGFGRGLIAGGLLLAAVTGLDAGLSGSAIFVAAYPLAAVVASAFSLVATIVIWLLAVLLAALSGLWNDNGGMLDYWIRLAFVVAGGAFAVFLARRREHSEELSSRLVLLDEIGSTADGSLALDETISRALAGMVPAAADFCMIDTVRDGEVRRVAVRARGTARWQEIEDGLRQRRPSTPGWLRDPELGIPLIPYFLPRVSSGHEEILAHDTGDDLVFIRSLGMRSVIIAPMIARGRLLGTLTIAVAWSGRHYGRDDLAFARALAGRLALALENAGLFSDLESVERRMDAVMSKIPEAVMVHDSSGTLVFANRTAAEWAGFETGEEIVAAGFAGLRERLRIFDEAGTELEEEDLIARALRAGRLPFRRLARVVTAFDGRERWLVISADAIRGPEGDALYAVTTMEDVTDTKRAELGQRVIARTAELLAGSSDLSDALQRVAELAVPDLADACTINLISADGQVSDAGDPGVAADAESVHAAGESGHGPAITVSIRGGGRVFGTLTFANAPDGRQFSEGDVALAGEMADRAGAAIESARLARLRRDIADTLQHGLLPPALPSMDGWSIAAMYHPAGELNEVGGDFYDAFEVENGWMVVVGDVVGRGAKAAALTALVRHTLNTACSLTGDPRQALALLNRRLLALGDQPLCTAAVVVLAKSGGGAADAVVVSAGHPIPLLLRGDAVEEACRPGPMLGAVEDAEWHLDLVSLEPGQQLVIYTDGVTDARIDGQVLGEGRLRAGLAGASDPAGAIDRIEVALGSYLSGDDADDTAAVAIMRAPGAGARPARRSLTTARASGPERRT